MSQKTRHIIKGLLLALLLMVTAGVSAEEETFEPGKFIFGHTRNAYGWHITTLTGENGEKQHISIPLPVIVKSEKAGWLVFSSAHLEHGSYEYAGTRFRLSEDASRVGRLVEVIDGEEVRPWDLSITKDVMEVLIAAAFLLIVFFCLTRHYKRTPMKAPGGFLGCIEVVILFIVNEVCKPCIGKDYKRYTPYLLTVFFFIWTLNLLGMIPIFPGGANVTGNLAVTMVLASISFVFINVFASKEYWKDIFLVPASPMWLKVPVPIMPLLEFVGVFTKPLALMIRLFANILAGHIIELVFMVLIFIFGMKSQSMGTGVGIFSVAFAFFMQVLEVLLASIQAYVFTLLSAVFIGLSKVESE